MENSTQVLAEHKEKWEKGWMEEQTQEKEKRVFEAELKSFVSREWHKNLL